MSPINIKNDGQLNHPINSTRGGTQKYVQSIERPKRDFVKWLVGVEVKLLAWCGESIKVDATMVWDTANWVSHLN